MEVALIFKRISLVVQQGIIFHDASQTNARDTCLPTMNTVIAVFTLI